MSNKALRQALMMGTDLNTIKSVIYGDGVTYSWPFAPGVPGYVDFSTLPAADQALWTYSVSGAKKMMSDAGYPNGFKVEILVSSANSQQVDLANLLVSQWSKIGVTANINIGDSTSVGTAFNNVTYKDMIMQNFTVVNPVTAMNVARATGAGSIYSVNEPEGLKQENLYVQMSATVDPVARTGLLQQLGLAYMDDVGTIGFTNPYVINAYWPWFKNYYGELDASYYNEMPMIMRGWIDQNLKKSLGH
jgi:peptide/nickel transport system substrate-binding protein